MELLAEGTDDAKREVGKEDKGTMNGLTTLTIDLIIGTSHTQGNCSGNSATFLFLAPSVQKVVVLWDFDNTAGDGWNQCEAAKFQQTGTWLPKGKRPDLLNWTETAKIGRRKGLEPR